MGVGAFHLAFPSLVPPGVDPQASFRAFLLACPLIGFYRAGGFGRTLPPISAFLPFEFIRSALFLVACFPFLLLWKASRGSLIFSLGLAFWVLNGLFGLLQSLGFPPVLRIAHSLEIGADSFVHAAVPSSS
jgi:hypothetical protein